MSKKLSQEDINKMSKREIIEALPKYSGRLCESNLASIDRNKHRLSSSTLKQIDIELKESLKKENEMLDRVESMLEKRLLELLKSQQPMSKEKTAEEYWDEFSVRLPDDIGDLISYADTDMIDKVDFLQAMEQYAEQKLKEREDEVINAARSAWYAGRNEEQKELHEIRTFNEYWKEELNHPQ